MWHLLKQGLYLREEAVLYHRSVIRFMLLSIIVASMAPLAHAAPCVFSLKGKLAVQSQFEEIKDRVIPLQGVEMRLLAASNRPYKWDVWQVARTDDKGEFSFWSRRKDKSCNQGTYLKIEARFRGVDNFEVSAGEHRWYSLYESGAQRLRSADIDFNNLIFKEGGEKTLGADALRGQADIWTLYQKALVYFKALGGTYAFNQGFEVIYPHDGTVPDVTQPPLWRSSYVNPMNSTLYIVEADLNSRALLAKLMQLWMYRHDASYGEKAVQEPSIAFHTAFADYASGALRNVIFGYSDTQLPYSRSHLQRLLRKGRLGGLEYSTSNWLSMFNFLTLADVGMYDLDGQEFALKRYNPVRCRNNNLAFEDILAVIVTSGDGGYGDYIATGDVDVTTFIQRADAVLEKFPSKYAEYYVRLLNTEETRQPKDFFCR